MVARCSCGKVWNISIKLDLSIPYVCPDCMAETKKIENRHNKKAKNEPSKISKVLLKNKNRVLRGDNCEK